MYQTSIVYDIENDIKDLNYLEISSFFKSKGLEIEVSEEVPETKQKIWKCVDLDKGILVAASTLEIRDGLYVLGDLAVQEEYRGLHIGKALHDKVLEEAQKRGASEIWACAKVPEYYKQYGWFEIDRAKSPNISHCNECEEFNISCFPAIIKKIF